jgi:sialic acid synthase SpsE
MTYIIAEIGLNHDGNFRKALDLIDAAAESGVNAVKFQYRNKDRVKRQPRVEIGDEILGDFISDAYLSPAEIRKLAQHGHSLGMSVGLSLFSMEDLKDFQEDALSFEFFKIPSVEFGNIGLVKKLRETGRTLLLSLGSQHESTIVDRLQEYGRECVLMHCVSNYPVAMHNSKLGYIKWLKRNYENPIGYSSHDQHYELVIIALSYGIDYLERHITISKDDLGLDHSSSSTPDEFKKIVEFARNIQTITAGDGPRSPNQGELLNLQNLGSSYYVSRLVQPGEVLGPDDIVLQSPRVGLIDQDFEMINSKPILVQKTKNQPLTRSDYIGISPLPEEDKYFCIKNNIGLPVRIHDFKTLREMFGIHCYEFHLSYGEVDLTLPHDIGHGSDTYSIHLPDYISQHHLFDPFSDDSWIRERSTSLLQAISDFCCSLSDETGAAVPLVGSFSVLTGGSTQNFYKNVAELVEMLAVREIKLYPQWLPPYAWYFGGSVPLHVFNTSDQIGHIERFEMPICLDTSHFLMGCYRGFTETERDLDRLLSRTGHIHLSSASGVDDEGAGFANLPTKAQTVISKSFGRSCKKIIEVWQGHLDNFKGFKDSISDLHRLFPTARDSIE